MRRSAASPNRRVDRRMVHPSYLRMKTISGGDAAYTSAGSQCRCTRARVSVERFIRTRWLTEMQCQKVLEERDTADPKPQPDEDGPASSEGAEDVRDITDDESMSDSGERPDKPHGAIFGGYFEQPLGSRGRAMSCALRLASSPSRLFSSRRALAPRQQREAKCAIHALNNCLGGLRRALLFSCSFPPPRPPSPRPRL